MAELSEAFNGLKFESKKFKNIDYFFTQRSLKEDHEYFDKNMNRLNKKVQMVYNFLAISIPNPTTSTDNNKEYCFEIMIYGDAGYHYKGIITSYQKNIPNFMIPLKGDKKLFVNIKYKENNENLEVNEYVCFIEVPKRYKTKINMDDDITVEDDNVSISESVDK